ncbi:MAG: 2-hydroxyacyl-CoA dehydratase family protein [Thermodesulfobacteriota bacterium]|nr:2-hydroxyacyl-CoA dehydratase family protein [Thermodesulfobacteriota bacterium]
MSEYKLNRLETTKLIGPIVDNHWANLRKAKENGEQVAWCSGPMFAFPYAMGMKCHFMAGYAAYAGGRGAAQHLLEVAEGEGDLVDACSYHKLHMGMAAAVKKGIPVREDVILPLPDLLITGRLCPEMSHYGEGLYRRMGINVVGIDTPPPASPSEVHDLERFAEGQIRENLIPELERICGKPFDYDRLSEILATLKETAIIRNECWEYFKLKPSPWTLWDYGVSIAPVFYMMGSPEAVPYYKKLKAELAERAEKKIGAVEPEKHRVYWDGWLPWGFLGKFSRKMTSLGIVPLVGRYPWEFFPHPETIDTEEDPVKCFTKQVYSNGGLAKQNMPNMSLPTIQRWIEDYKIDGVIMFSSKTCRMWNLGHPDFINAIEKKNGIPGVVIDGDMVDARMNSDAQIETRLEALAEMMEARRK